MKIITAIAVTFLATLQLHSQGYIVPNGVVTNLFPGEIDVWNPGTQVTGFSLTPSGEQQPTSYTNLFSFFEPITIGVRVFLVQPNDAISLQPILSQSWTELGGSTAYLFQSGVPFYVGLYTGDSIAPPGPFFPPYTYNNPVFGWAELENVNGTIELLNSALEYGGAGIYAGTQNIIQSAPEPSVLGLSALGGLFLACRRWKNPSR